MNEKLSKFEQGNEEINTHYEDLKNSINTALQKAEKEDWHEVWVLFSGEINSIVANEVNYLTGHPFLNSVKKEKLQKLDEICAEIEKLLGDENDIGRAEIISHGANIHPSFIRKEIDKVREKLKEIAAWEDPYKK